MTWRVLFGFPRCGVKLVEKFGVGHGVVGTIPVVVVGIDIRYYFGGRAVGKPLPWVIG
jgi:hypothetical protein